MTRPVTVRPTGTSVPNLMISSIPEDSSVVFIRATASTTPFSVASYNSADDMEILDAPINSNISFIAPPPDLIFTPFKSSGTLVSSFVDQIAYGGDTTCTKGTTPFL